MQLYFVAYQDKIHVYRAQSAPEILRPQPELVLQPRQSVAARQIRGFVDPAFPHQVNHLITGDLGNFEILLLNYDDGDVIAYYMHKIASYVERHSSIWNLKPPSPGKVPKAFFHESVGVSAWGLAIHKKSRLIAVSSNLHEVTIFAFALHKTKASPLDKDVKQTFKDEDDTSPKTWAGMSAVQLERQLRARDRDWRLLLPIGETGHNMPNVSFWDDMHGNAEKIAAIDINGYCWLLDIWKVGSRPVRIGPSSNQL